MNGQDEVIGRDDALERLEQAARYGNVVISGPPGVGKTTLAREVARRLDGPVLFCDLTDARTFDDLVAVVSEALALDPQPASSASAQAERIADALTRRGVQVVVLDNFDHVAEHAKSVESWSSREGCRLILTSRSPVPLSATTQFPTEPLEEDAAVRLYEVRAASVAPGFRITPDDEEIVRELIRRLDRLPLPIELAAARSHVLEPRQILLRVDQRLETLTDQRTGRSLLGALRWTWDLLSTEDQQGLSQCTIFRGPFSFADAEAVVQVADATTLDIIDRLVTGGWIRSARRQNGERVFTLFESVRDFARSQLDEERTTQLEARYASHLHRRATRGAAAIEGPEGVRAFAELVRDEHALRWAAELWVERGRPEGPEIVAALAYPIIFHSRVVDWMGLVARAARLAEEFSLDTAVRVALLLGQMQLLVRQMPAADEQIRRAHALAVRGAGPSVTLQASRALAVVVATRDPSAAVGALDGALVESRRTRDEFATAQLLERRGFVQSRLFRLDAAQESFEEAHDILLRVSNPLFVGESLAGLGYVAWRRGDLETATRSFSEAVRAHQQSGNRAREASARFNLGAVLHCGGRADDAAHQVESALALWDDLALRQFRAAGLVRRALLECEFGSSTEARRLAQEARAEADGRNDRHNAGLAEGVLALARLSQNKTVDVPALELTLATLNMGADPIAVATHLAVLAGTTTDAAKRDHVLNRMDELRSLASEQDVYVDETLAVLDTLARGLAQIQTWTAVGGSLGRVRVARETATSNAVQRSPYARLVARWLEARCVAELGDANLSAQRVLIVHPDALWFRLDGGERVDLTTRKPLRLILRFFVDLALRDRLAGAAVADLVPVGWPGEQVDERSGKNRVYTAIRFLRDLGLEGVLVTGDRGYQLSPDVRIERPTEIGHPPP